MLPFLDVIDLPQSTSFFSAVCQPLGLRYISSSTVPGAGEDSDFRSVTFGVSSAQPLFQIRQVADPPPSQPPAPLKLSRVVLSAPSATAVRDFHAFALRAHPEAAASIQPLDPESDDQPPGLRATITDLDGNKMAVVYQPPLDYGRHYSGSTIRRTQSTDKEAASIMSWNYDVAASSSGSIAGSRTLARRFTTADDPLDDRPYTTLLRHTYTTTSTVPSEAPSIRESSKGLSTAGIASMIGLGAAVGAGVGAAVTYSLSMRERARAPHQEFDAAPPAFSRRSTFPDPTPAYAPREYIEVERTVEKIRGYPDDVFGTFRNPPPTHIARYNRAGASPPRTIVSTSRDDAAYDDTRRGRHHPPSSSASHRLHRPRTRSESAPLHRAPLLLTDTEHRSFTGSAADRDPIPAPSRISVRRAATYHDDGETYVSAKSRRSSSTARPPPPPVGIIALPPPPMGSHAMSVRGAGSSHSRHSGSTIKPAPVKSYVSARNVPLPPSHVSARNVPLPPSRVGSMSSRRGSREEDWEVDSVAPSDSISCVGSRRSSSRRYH